MPRPEPAPGVYPQRRGPVAISTGAQARGVRAAGFVFMAAALLSVLRITAFKRWLPSEVGSAPVFAVAFIQAMLGLALLQGSEIARKFVLIVSTLGMLGLLGLLAVATNMDPDLERIGFLVWMIAAAVLIPPFLAIVGLLVGESPSGLRVGVCVGILALYTLGGFGLELAAFRAMERAVQAEMAQWTAADRAFSDPAQGLAVTMPGAWMLMRAESPLVTESGARLAFGHPQSTTLAVFHTEELRDGPGAPNAYLDRILETRLKDRDGLQGERRDPTTVGGAEAQRLWVSWRQNQRPYRGWIVVWQDGWRYFSLMGWAPASREEAARAAFLQLERSFQFTPVLTRQLGEVVSQVTAIAPHLSTPAVKALLARYPDRQPSPTALFRLGHRWSVKGLENLTPGEVKEMGEITSVLFAAIPSRDRSNLGAYLERVRFDRPTTPAEDGDMARVMKTGTDRLPPESLQRLQVLLERAIATGTLLEAQQR